MKQADYFVVNTYGSNQDAIAASIEKGLNPEESVYMCPHGEFGYEIRIYDDWQEFQPDLYTQK